MLSLKLNSACSPSSSTWLLRKNPLFLPSLVATLDVLELAHDNDNVRLRYVAVILQMFSFLPSTLPLGPGFCVWFLPQVGLHLHHDVFLVLTCLAYCLGRTWPLTSPMWAWSACMAPRQFDQHQAQIFPPSLKSHDFFYIFLFFLLIRTKHKATH